MTHELHPMAIELARLDRHVASLKTKLATAQAERGKIREKIKREIIRLIAEDPQLTNVQIAAMFGLKSETTVRNLRVGR
jgi:predicted HTH transcriptional regulator